MEEETKEQPPGESGREVDVTRDTGQGTRKQREPGKRWEEAWESIGEKAPEINIEHLLLWIEALESGKYSQGRQALRDGDSFCCLGVACEVGIRAGVSLRQNFNPRDGYIYRTEEAVLRENEVLPQPIKGWLGIEFPDLLITYPVGGEMITTWCAEANDEYGLTFLDIAAALRHTYLEPQA